MYAEGCRRVYAAQPLRKRACPPPSPPPTEKAMMPPLQWVTVYHPWLLYHTSSGYLVALTHVLMKASCTGHCQPLATKHTGSSWCNVLLWRYLTIEYLNSCTGTSGSHCVLLVLARLQSPLILLIKAMHCYKQVTVVLAWPESCYWVYFGCSVIFMRASYHRNFGLGSGWFFLRLPDCYPVQVLSFCVFSSFRLESLSASTCSSCLSCVSLFIFSLVIALWLLSVLKTGFYMQLLDALKYHCTVTFAQSAFSKL